MKEFIMLTGPPGSGKTTWINKNLDRFEGYIFLSFDNLFERDETGERIWRDAEGNIHYKYNGVTEEVLDIYRAKITKQIDETLKSGKNILFECAYPQPPERRRKIIQAHNHGYVVKAIYMFPLLETCLARNKTRKDRVAEDALWYRHSRFQPPQYYEGFVEIEKITEVEDDY